MVLQNLVIKITDLDQDQKTLIRRISYSIFKNTLIFLNVQIDILDQ